MKKSFVGACIQDACWYCYIGGYNGRNYYAYGDLTPLTSEEVEAIRKLDSDYCDEDGAWHAVLRDDLDGVLSAHRMAHLELEYDSDEELNILQSCLKPAKYYLLYGDSMTWDGRSGYKIIGDLSEALCRDYEVSDTIADYNGRALALRESSHDVPMGAPFYIIGIDERTRRTLENSDFAAVKRFVDQAVDELDSGKEDA